MKRYDAVISGSIEPMPGTHLIVLDCAPLAQAASPGQFLMVRCGEGTDPYLRVPLPIHRLVAGTLSLGLRGTDRATNWLAARHVGEGLDVLGPCGHGFDPPASGEAVALIARGAGVLPLLALLDRVDGPVQLLVSTPSRLQVYPRELLPQRCEYLPFVGHRQRDAFLEAVRAAAVWANRLYAGGPLAFYARLQDALRWARPTAPGRSACQVWLEAQMACGRGVCQACAVEMRDGWKRVCVDGPVFDLEDMILM